MSKRCEATTKSGAPCSAPAVGDTTHCFWHTPKAAAEAGKKSGQAKAARDLADLSRLAPHSDSPADVSRCLREVIRECLRDKLDVNRARVVIYGCAQVAACWQTKTLEELASRIAALESRAG